MIDISRELYAIEIKYDQCKWRLLTRADIKPYRRRWPRIFKKVYTSEAQAIRYLNELPAELKSQCQVMLYLPTRLER